MEKGKLIPGFHFNPTDVELLKYFLKRKVTGKKLPNVIAEINIYQYCPWDLPDKSHLKSGDSQWYFFYARGKKYGIGSKTNRSTKNGYWKATAKDKANKQTVGMMKTLVFHIGKAPRGDQTDWVMHEYRLQDKDLTHKGIAQDSYVICKVFRKEGRGPRRGAQYGKPFNEEDWDDDDDDDDDHHVVEEGETPSTALVVPAPIQSITFDGSSYMKSTSISCESGPVATSPVPPTPSSDASIHTVNNVNNSIVADLSKEENTVPKKKIAGGDPLSKFFAGLEDLESEYTPNGVGLEDFAPTGITDDDLGYLEISDLNFL